MYSGCQRIVVNIFLYAPCPGNMIKSTNILNNKFSLNDFVTLIHVNTIYQSGKWRCSEHLANT
jgi:chaperone required for assembly of F1-ATPase